jgi:hypothetical protein
MRLCQCLGWCQSLHPGQNIGHLPWFPLYHSPANHLLIHFTNLYYHIQMITNACQFHKLVMINYEVASYKLLFNLFNLNSNWIWFDGISLHAMENITILKP